jgi:hypothetical protein
VTTFRMFQRPVTRAVHKTRMLYLLRLFTLNGFRGKHVRRYQQISLVRNRLNLSWQHPRICELIRRYGCEL